MNLITRRKFLAQAGAAALGGVAWEKSSGGVMIPKRRRPFWLASQGTAPSKTNLKAWYKLSDLTNSHGAPGSLLNNNSATFVSGKNNEAARFTTGAPGSYLSLAHHADLASADQQAFSVSAWMKFRDAGTVRCAVHKSGAAGADANWLLQATQNISSNTSLSLLVWNLAGTSTTATQASLGLIPVDTWFHVAATISNAVTAVTTVYLNGVTTGSTTGSCLGRQISTTDFVIGARPLNSLYYNTDVDDVAVWQGEALTQANINWLAAGGSYTDLP